MKHLKVFLTIAISLAMVVAFCQTPVKAQAAGATTWYLTYDVGTGAWYGSTDKVYWSYPDISKMQAGDNLVIDADNANSVQFIVNAPQSINELAVVGGASVVVNAPYVAHAYSVNGATTAINSNVGLVDAYHTGVIQVNGNVDKIVGHYDDSAETIFGVSGTVGQANVKWTKDLLSNNTTVYNVAKGKMTTNEWGWVPLEEGDYSLTPSASTTTTKANTTQKQLDSVPKTGVAGMRESFIFFALAAVFAIGAVVYKKKAL